MPIHYPGGSGALVPHQHSSPADGGVLHSRFTQVNRGDVAGIGALEEVRA